MRRLLIILGDQRDRHRNRLRLAGVPRMGFKLRNLARIHQEELAAIQDQARSLRERLASGQGLLPSGRNAS